MGLQPMKYGVFLFTLILLHACKSMDEKAYGRYLGDERNGLQKTRYVSGMEIKVKYLPVDYLVACELKTLQHPTIKDRDSILNLYKGTVNISMSIGPDERTKKGADVMTIGVNTYEEYAGRSRSMNFDMEKLVKIKSEDKEYHPVLSALQNTYGLTSRRDIVFAFVSGDKNDNRLEKAEEMDFIYTDEFFGLGTNHFVFSRKDLDNIPSYPIETLLSKEIISNDKRNL